MKWFFALSLLFAGILALSLAGCYGTTKALDPVIVFDIPDDTTLPSIASGGLLVVKWSVTIPNADDKITKYQWTQDVADPQYQGTFLLPEGPTTTWQAPEWHGPGNLPVTLTFTVDTLLGGHAAQHINLLITPAP